MDDAELRRRLWEGFAALQTLLGGSARNGWVLRKDGLVASIVPSAPDSPALNAAVALDPEVAPDALHRARGHLRRRGRAPLGGVDRRRRAARHERSSEPGSGDRLRDRPGWAR